MSKAQTETKAKPRLLVDFVADPVCPWCYVGLRSLIAARDKLAVEFDVIIRLRPYQLNPDTPIKGVDRAAYYEKKFPDKNFRAAMRESLIEAAKESGFDFNPMRPKHLPNTLKAHRLLHWSHFKGAHENVALGLYQAFWENGADIGDIETLTSIAEQAGLDATEIREKLESGVDDEIVAREADGFKAAGVAGVPTYIVNENAGFSGAMAPEKLAATIIKASRQPYRQSGAA